MEKKRITDEYSVYNEERNGIAVNKGLLKDGDDDYHYYEYVCCHPLD